MNASVLQDANEDTSGCPNKGANEVVVGAVHLRRAVNESNLEKKMQANVGSVDRIIRIVAGLALIAATLSGLIGVWGWLGLILVGTGVFRFCPAYLPFGFRTCKTRQENGK